MMRRASLVFLLNAASVLATEAEVPTLTVFVRENNSSGGPMAGVQITAPEASPAVTDSTGKKKLVFPRRQVGDTLELSIYRDGYELVNDFQRSVTLPRESTTELNLFLCQPERCYEERLRFVRLSADPLKRKLEAEFQAQLKDLEKQGKATAERLARVQAERDQALSTVDKLTEKLAQLEPGEGSSIYRRAAQLFLEGKLEEALSELETAKLNKERELARARQETVRKDLENLASSYVLRGQILVLQLNFGAAEEAFEEAIGTSPESLEAGSALALFLAKQNNFTKATVEYERVLQLARRRSDQAQVATSLNNLGLLHGIQNRMVEARIAFEEALSIRQDLAVKSPEIYLIEVAASLNNLGTLYSDQNQLEEARHFFEEALRIRREMALKTFHRDPSDLAAVLHNLGNVNSKQNRSEEAYAAYEEALLIRRQLANTISQVYLPDVVMTLNSLGALHYGQNRSDEARVAFEEALRIQRGLAIKSPEVYLPELVTALTNLGNLYIQQARLEDAQAAFDEALPVSRKLAKHNPLVYQSNLAMLLHNFGVLYVEQNRLADAQAAYDEALRIFRELAVKNTLVYRPDVARTLYNLGRLNTRLNRMDDARAAFKEALGIFRELAIGSPERFLPTLADLLENLGRVEVQTSNSRAALLLWTEALAARNRFAELRPPGARSEMALTAGKIARAQAMAGQAQEAINGARYALSLVFALSPEEWQALDPDGRRTLRQMTVQLLAFVDSVSAPPLP